MTHARRSCPVGRTPIQPAYCRVAYGRRGRPLATTSASLLERLRLPDPAAADWDRLHGLYTPLIRRWVARVPGVGPDADDVCQEVLAVLVAALPGFERQRDGSFRAWLRLVTVNRRRGWRRGWRRGRAPVPSDPAEAFLVGLEDPAGDLAAEWDREHARHVPERLLAAVRDDFTPPVWAACERLPLAGEPAAGVAATLGMTVDAVLQAKSRVLRRLRREAGGLLE